MVRSYLDWLIELPWALPEREADRYRARPGAYSMRIISASRRSRARIIEYLAVRKLAPQRQGADPLLRRPARRRQDVARTIDRTRDGPAVRARQPRRRSRRGGDPRPPAHLYRRAARQHHPGHQEGRLPQLRDDARRDRQDGTRRPGRSVGGDARGARSRAELRRSATITSACPSISRASRSSRPPTCSTRFRDRCWTGWRSSASPATPRMRSSRSRGAIWFAASWRRMA